MAKAKPHVPQTPDEMTVPWFNTAMAAHSGGARITEAQPKIIGEGIGFMGDIYRCALTWDSDDETLPATVIVKVPSQIPANQSLGEGIGVYEREIQIYRHAGGRLGLPMPKHYYSEFEPAPAPWLESFIYLLFDKLPVKGVQVLSNKGLKYAEKMLRKYVLVIEDIADARPPAQVEGGTVDDALAALRILAAFHATHWRSKAIVDQAGSIHPINRTPKIFQAAYLTNRDDFFENFGELLGPKVVAHLERVQERLPQMMDSLVAEPATLQHGDFRLDNVMFKPDGELVVIDFQMMEWGRAGWDVSYFITTALNPEHRSQEELMLRTYHDALVAEGIDDYSFEDLRRDVSTAKDIMCHRMVGGGSMVDTTMAHGDDDTFLDLLVQRTAAWLDLD